MKDKGNALVCFQTSTYNLFEEDFYSILHQSTEDYYDLLIVVIIRFVFMINIYVQIL